MIVLDQISKSFAMPGGRKAILHNVSLTIPPRVSVALLGRNGAGKSTLLEMIGGRLLPDAGRITCRGSISWPVGFSGGFHGDMTGLQNTRFIARIYGVDSAELVAFVQDFAELGREFFMPVRNYSSGMRARLAFAVSIGIPFDTYLVDEVTSVGDAAFKRKSQAVFESRMENAGAIVVSHSMPQIRRMCEAGIVIEAGQVRYFDDLADAIDLHEANLQIGLPMAS
jgi:capsular polysaccharide transport system ATP-binding protein